MENNQIASIIKGYAILNAVAGCIGGLVIAANMDNMVVFLIVAAVIAVVSFGMYAFGEIIQLLHDIKMNTLGTKEAVGTPKGKTFDSSALPKL